MITRALLEILGIRKRGLREEFDHRVGQQLDALGRFSALRHVLARRKRRKAYSAILKGDPEFYVLQRGVAISATWLSAVSVAILEDIASPKGDLEKRAASEQAAALAFFSRLANDLWAIIELVERGFDIQARGLSRSFLEHVDVLICCIHDKELTEKFANAVEPEDANHFWHQYVSKNKMKRKVAELITTNTRLYGSDIVDALREPAELAGSAIIHPTMLAGMAVALGEEGEEYETHPIFPHPIFASSGIFRTVLVHRFWLLLMMGPLPRAPYGAWGSLIDDADIRDNKMLAALQRINRDMHGFMLDWHLTMKPEKDQDGSHDLPIC